MGLSHRGVSEEDSGMHLRFEGEETGSSGCVFTCLSTFKHEISHLKKVLIPINRDLILTCSVIICIVNQLQCLDRII